MVLFTPFLDASSHLYKRVCPSVRPLTLRKNRRETHLIARPGLLSYLLALYIRKCFNFRERNQLFTWRPTVRDLNVPGAPLKVQSGSGSRVIAAAKCNRRLRIRFRKVSVANHYNSEKKKIGNRLDTKFLNTLHQKLLRIFMIINLTSFLVFYCYIPRYRPGRILSQYAN